MNTTPIISRHLPSATVGTIKQFLRLLEFNSAVSGVAYNDGVLVVLFARSVTACTSVLASSLARGF